MADFIWSQEKISKISRFDKLYSNNMLQPMVNINIFGIEGTFTHIQKDNNFITVLGFSTFPGESIKNTISEIFNDFDESKISELKKELIGQFIIIVKKGIFIYVFGDVWQIRNIFYSKDFNLISSSFSAIEEVLGTSSKDLDRNKILEFIALKQFSYPGWLGNKTLHSKVKFLRPYEYIKIDSSNHDINISKIYFEIDNYKNKDIKKLSSDLINCLKAAIQNPYYRNEMIGVTLTGGFDSRLVAAISANYFKKASFRIATLDNNRNSLKDAKIAKKIANITKIPLKLFNSIPDEDLFRKFYFLSEGLSPLENSVTTPILIKNGSFSLGLGGCFGTEHFKPIDKYSKIDGFIEKSIVKAKRKINTTQEKWEQLRFSIDEEFKEIEKYYKLTNPNDLDIIRIFLLLRTAFFSSFMLAAYNIKGLQLEPYSYFKILEIALRVPEELCTSNGNLKNSFIIQKMAISNEYDNIGKITTTHYQPMLPYKMKTFPYYFYGNLNFYYDRLLSRIRKSNSKKQLEKNIRIDNNFNYLSDGWDQLFLKHTYEKYGLKAKILDAN
ncbi:MAG: hypothetical protein ACTSO2_19275 [Promethearchaeota archaeon]